MSEIPEFKKPQCPLVGADSNVFNIMGLASNALKSNGFREQAKEMIERVTQSGDYYKAIGIIM